MRRRVSRGAFHGDAQVAVIGQGETVQPRGPVESEPGDVLIGSFLKHGRSSYTRGAMPSSARPGASRGGGYQILWIGDGILPDGNSCIRLTVRIEAGAGRVTWLNSGLRVRGPSLPVEAPGSDVGSLSARKLYNFRRTPASA